VIMRSTPAFSPLALVMTPKNWTGAIVNVQ
jgi:hypothetical protein